MRCKTINYKGKRWEKLRKSVLKRDGYMCRVCRRYGKRVDAEVVHHIYPVSDYPEYRWSSWNLLSPTCPLNPFRPGETLALSIWAARTEALAANSAQLADLASAILMLLVLSFSLGARCLSSYLDTKSGGSK